MTDSLDVSSGSPQAEAMRLPHLLLAVTCGLSFTLVACKKDEPQSSSPQAPVQQTTAQQGAGAQATPASAVTTAAPTDPLAAAAQIQLNQRNQGRACTILTRARFQAGLEDMPEYRKSVLLESRGLATRSQVQKRSVKETVFTYKTDIKETDGNGIFFTDPAGIIYCYGKWAVQSAQPTNIYQSAQGYQSNVAAVKLTDAPSWVVSDPAAAVLTVQNDPSDNTVLPVLGENDQRVAASLTGVNRVPISTPKQ